MRGLAATTVADYPRTTDKEVIIKG